MAAPGAGRPDLPRRLKRRFAVFAVPAPAPADAAAVLAALLGGHFAAPAFPRGLAAAAVSAAVPATLALAERAARRLLPTPARFHYSFTLRELAAVAQGMALADTGSFSKDGHERELAALWAHEARRVFSDRLVGDDERAWVDAQVRELLSAHFGAAGAAAAAAPPAVYATFLRDAPVDEATGEARGPRPSTYEPARGGLPQVRARVESLLAAESSSGASGRAAAGAHAELVLFDGALEHLLRLGRALAAERGHALLAGVGGSGKQSLARLAAALAGARTFQAQPVPRPPGTPGAPPALLEELRGLVRHAALQGQHVCWVVTDADARDETVLDVVNQVLTTGEVAGLFPRDELDAALVEARPLMRAAAPGEPDTPERLARFFFDRARGELRMGGGVASRAFAAAHLRLSACQTLRSLRLSLLLHPPPTSPTAQRASTSSHA